MFNFGLHDSEALEIEVGDEGHDSIQRVRRRRLFHDSSVISAIIVRGVCAERHVRRRARTQLSAVFVRRRLANDCTTEALINVAATFDLVGARWFPDGRTSRALVSCALSCRLFVVISTTSGDVVPNGIVILLLLLLALSLACTPHVIEVIEHLIEKLRTESFAHSLLALLARDVLVVQLRPTS